MKHNTIIIVVLFLSSCALTAQINTDRPDQTESSSTVPNPGQPPTLTVQNSFFFTTFKNVNTRESGGGLECSAGPIVFKA